MYSLSISAQIFFSLTSDNLLFNLNSTVVRIWFNCFYSSIPKPVNTSGLTLSIPNFVIITIHNSYENMINFSSKYGQLLRLMVIVL